MPSKKRGRPKKQTQKGPTKAQLEKIRAKGIFDAAKKAEQFGQHPGYVDLKIRFSIYNPITQQEERLPGKEMKLEVSSIEEVDAMTIVIREALIDWIAGMTRVTRVTKE